MTIAVGSDSVTLQDFTDGSYSLHYGSTDTLLGRLTVANTDGGATTATPNNDGVTELIVGLAGVDLLQGDARSDFLYGGDDGDTLNGNGGVDTLYGGAGGDQLSGGEGVDTLYGGIGNDFLDGGIGNDFLNGGTGADTYTFESGHGTDTIADADGGELNFKAATGLDSFQFSRDGANVVISIRDSGSVTIENLAVGVGRYILSYGSGNTELGRLYVGDGNDNAFTGSDGKDLMIGLAGIDTLRGGNEGDDIHGGRGNDKLYGDAGTDTLRGGDNNDELYGGAGNDALEGGAGNDTYIFESGDGNDIITDDGGKLYFKAATGIESFAFSREGDNLKITVGSDSVTIEDFANGEYTLHYGTDDTPLGRLSLATSEGGTLSARSGNQPDVIVGSTVVDTLDGGAGNDILQGGADDDTLYGGAGDDILQGGADDDTLDGGAGNDTLEGGAGTDDTYIFESGDGADTIQGDTDGGKLYFKDAAGIDSFSIARNAQGDARIEVGSDSVTIKDFANGKYTLHHGTGDTPLGRISLATTAGGRINAGSDDKADLMIGSGGADFFAGLAGNDFLYGGEGSDTLYGGIGNDFLYGGAGIDNLHGDDGNDFLYGGGGVDTLTGGAGNDELYGGVGVDSYIFGGEHGADTIKDDTDGGKIYFKNAGSIDEFDIARDANGNAVFTLTSNSVTNSVTIEGYEENLFQLYGTVSGVDTLLEKKVFLGTDRGDSALTGSDGNDLLLGLAGVDTLQGLAGDDTLKGGEGNDILEGGAGSDEYIFEGEHGDDIIQGDTDGGELYFRNTESVSGIDFSLAGGDLTITVGTNSVEIKSFANDAYTLFYGGSDTELGQLSFGSAGEELRGTENADVLFGLEGVDEITGLGGADRIYGGDGGDTIIGGEGEDTLYGQKGNDILKGGAGADTYVFETGDGGDRVEEDTDGGTLYFKDVTDTNAFTFSTDDSGNTKIEVGEDSVTISIPDGSSAEYNVHYDSDSKLAGRLASGTDGNNAGSEALKGTDQADVLSGLAGNDEIYGGSTNTADQTGTGRDQLYGGDGDDTLYGGDGDDNLFGDADVDTLYGEAGDDTLTGGAGDDFLLGGAGTDTYVFETGDGADTIQSEDDGGRIYLRNAAGLSDLTISRDGNKLKITVAADSVTIEGYTKTDSSTLDGRFALHYGSEDTELGKLTLGTDGDDTSLTGTADADLMLGLEGADTLTGGGGEDQLYGDEGVDTLYGGADADTLYGGAEADTLQGGAGADILYGGDEDTDDSTGDTASYADSASDSTDATKGVTVSLVADSIGEGADAKGDTLFGIENLVGSGYIDTLTGDDKDNTIDGGAGADTLYGGVGGDTLIGGDGADTLYGGASIDTLQGGVGADTLTGGEGDDFLEGGGGADTYAFEEGHGEDTIRNDADGGELNFQHATGFDNLAFSRNAEGDVVVAVDGNSGDSVKIVSGVYDHGSFTISYGVGNDKAELGRLSLATETGERAVTAAGDAGKDLMIGSGVRDILTGGGGGTTISTAMRATTSSTAARAQTPSTAVTGGIHSTATRAQTPSTAVWV